MYRFSRQKSVPSNQPQQNPHQNNHHNNNHHHHQQQHENNKDKNHGSFINSYLKGHLNKHHPDIICGKTCYDLPVKEINKLNSKVVAAYTGPSGGLTKVNLRQKPTAFELPADAEVDFIDEDYNENGDSLSSTKSSPCHPAGDHLNNNGKNERSQRPSSSSSSDNDAYESSDSTGSGSGDKPYDRTATLALGEDTAGIANWEQPKDFAYGIATSLYEKHPQTSVNAGEPVADSFALCVRENSAILALADGVNWGERACIAARSAIHGSMDYLNKALYHEAGRIENTMDLFVALLRSFSAAHSMILQENGLLTTLTVAVVAQLKASDRFIVCTCNVGDSLAYVYSKEHGVREITQGSHDIFSMRDMRDALGALGPVDGQNPELNNLTVAMTIVDKGDIVFITSDGVSDNFDPVVGKFAIPKKAEKPNQAKTENAKEVQPAHPIKKQNSFHGQRRKNPSKRISGLRRSNSNPDRDSAHAPFPDPCLPIVTAEQRHALALLRMEDLLINGVKDTDTPCSSAKHLCEVLIEFVSKLTTAKRRILEDPELYDDNDTSFGQQEQRQRRRKVGEKLAMVPGKLDHASVVAYKVGFYGSLADKTFEEKKVGSSDDKRYNLKLKATLAKFESQEDFCSLYESKI